MEALNPQNEIDNQPWDCCCGRVVLAVLHVAFEQKKSEFTTVMALYQL